MFLWPTNICIVLLVKTEKLEENISHQYSVWISIFPHFFVQFSKISSFPKPDNTSERGKKANSIEPIKTRPHSTRRAMPRASRKIRRDRRGWVSSVSGLARPRPDSPVPRRLPLDVAGRAAAAAAGRLTSPIWIYGNNTIYAPHRRAATSAHRTAHTQHTQTDGQVSHQLWPFIAWSIFCSVNDTTIKIKWLMNNRPPRYCCPCAQRRSLFCGNVYGVIKIGNSKIKRNKLLRSI